MGHKKQSRDSYRCSHCSVVRPTYRRLGRASMKTLFVYLENNEISGITTANSDEERERAIGDILAMGGVNKDFNINIINIAGSSISYGNFDDYTPHVVKIAAWHVVKG